MVNSYRIIFVIVLLILGYLYPVYLIVLSLFMPKDTFINDFDNIFYLHVRLFYVSLFQE